MEISNLIPHIEALIFASDKPLSSPELTELINQAFGFMEDKVVPEQVDAALEGIVEKYNAEFYPFEVKQSGGGWQFLTKRDFHKTVAQLNGEKFLKRLSAAALETLAIIAYKQPVTKGEIEAIRGVSSDYAVQKLLEKELIIISGRNEKLPGHPLVYATSKNFMDYFGINSADDLPRIREVLAEQVIVPTPMQGGEVSEVLSVSDDGELVITPSEEIIDTTDTETPGTETDSTGTNEDQSTDTAAPDTETPAVNGSHFGAGTEEGIDADEEASEETGEDEPAEADEAETDIDDTNDTDTDEADEQDDYAAPDEDYAGDESEAYDAEEDDATGINEDAGDDEQDASDDDEDDDSTGDEDEQKDNRP